MEKQNSFKWYKIVGYEGHVGTRKSREVVLYIYSRDIINTLDQYKEISRIKSSWLPYAIETLTEAQEKELEKKIKNDFRVTLEYAKQNYYLYPKSYQNTINTRII